MPCAHTWIISADQHNIYKIILIPKLKKKNDSRYLSLLSQLYDKLSSYEKSCRTFEDLIKDHLKILKDDNLSRLFQKSLKDLENIL